MHVWNVFPDARKASNLVPALTSRRNRVNSRELIYRYCWYQLATAKEVAAKHVVLLGGLLHNHAAFLANPISSNHVTLH